LCWRCWRELAAHRHLIDAPTDPGEGQDCICIHIALFWTKTRATVSSYQSWLVEVSDHAAARLLQHAPTANLGRCLFDAADAYAAADADAVQRVVWPTSARSISKPVRDISPATSSPGSSSAPAAASSMAAPAPICPRRCWTR
jgi:hypothetical protein